VEFRDRSRSFSGLAAFGDITASLGVDERTELVTGGIVSGNYFDVLGVRAALGRTISPADDQTPGAHPVAVISRRASRCKPARIIPSSIKFSA
jgi:hypothetical protein